jgi:iron complex outermembrane receptor protein
MFHSPTFRASCGAWRLAAAFLAAVALLLILHVPQAHGDRSDLASLSIEDLMEVEVTSVSKHAQPLSDAAAAVYVITNEDIRRSGATSIAEALRLAPGLHVARIDSARWAITARGFNGQFANKLLVLIDGRTVYTHLFSGVYWDIQDVVLEDVDRIEVVRGPGGTLWGANAVNGVINIITKKASDTQGLLASGGGGSLDRAFGTVRYGAALGENAHLRGYVKYFDRSNFENEFGRDANDRWDATSGGFRLDWGFSQNDTLTLQGDVYDGSADTTLLVGTGNDDLGGGNIIGLWRHVLSGTSDLSLRLYYDRTERASDPILNADTDTADVEFQHRFSPFRSNDLIWGAGYRLINDRVDSNFLSIIPDKSKDHLASAFVQDQIALFGDRVELTVGSKFEHNDYTGFEFQPNIRVLWKPHARHSLWGAVSRAVRTPSRGERDLSFLLIQSGGLIIGNRDFDSEKLLAYELGYRTQLSDDLSFDLAAYYNDYDDIRTGEVGSIPLPTPPYPPGTLPTPLRNKAEAVAYGVELGANWKVTEHWTLSGWYTLMKVDVDVDADSTDTMTEATEHDTPSHQIHFRSRMNLPWNLEFDTLLFHAGDVPNQNTDEYTRLDLRLGWRPIEHVEVSVAGQNLVDRRHEEFGDGYFTLHGSVPRGVYGKITVRY